MRKFIIVFSLIFIIIIVAVIFYSQKAQPSGSQYACQSNDDCRLSCYWGAVSRKWYQENRKDKVDCLDGCNGIGMDARCVSGSCQAFLSGKPYDFCTYRKPQIFK